MEQATNNELKVRYEISFVTQSEDAASMKAVLTKHGATIVNERPITKIQLAYKINKLGYGFMGSAEFLADGSAVRELRKELGMDKDIIRALIAKKPEMKGDEGRAPREGERRPPSAPQRLKSMLGSMLSNEALEKKIEEILQ